MKYYYLKLDEELLRTVLFDCISHLTVIDECCSTIKFEYYKSSNQSLSIKSISVFDDDLTLSEKLYDSWFDDKNTVDEIEELCRKSGLNYSYSHVKEEAVNKLIIKRLGNFKNGVPRRYFKETHIEFFGESNDNFTCVIAASNKNVTRELCEYINDNCCFSKTLKFSLIEK